LIFSGIQRSSTIDFPGHLAAVLFSPGCNYDCFYCHNRRLLTREQPAETIDNGEVYSFLEKRKGLLDGIVLSGGEPTLQKDIVSFAQALSEMGYAVKLDTNGSNPAVVECLLPYLSYVAVDYKAPWEMYETFCGALANAEDVKKTIALLVAHKMPYELRTTVFPQLKEADLCRMAKAVEVQPKYVLKKYNMPELYKEEDLFRLRAKAYTTHELKMIAEKLREIQPNIVVQGGG
jgi:pyruvate formate lyase activating enzyme